MTKQDIKAYKGAVRKQAKIEWDAVEGTYKRFLYDCPIDCENACEGLIKIATELGKEYEWADSLMGYDTRMQSHMNTIITHAFELGRYKRKLEDAEK